LVPLWVAKIARGEPLSISNGPMDGQNARSVSLLPALLPDRIGNFCPPLRLFARDDRAPNTVSTAEPVGPQHDAARCPVIR